MTELHHRSDSLFHFTKTYANLRSILTCGFRPRYSPEDIRWLNFRGDSKIGIPMVSFCDIPLSLNETHIREFGRYGVGMSRRWGIENNIDPVRYIRQNSLVAQLYKSLHLTNKETMRLLATTIQNIWFVDECEWRYVPQSDDVRHIPQFVVDDTIENPARLKAFNDRLERFRMLKFQTIDIECIVVDREKEIADVVRDIDHLYPSTSNEERSRLKQSVRSSEMSGIQFIS